MPQFTQRQLVIFGGVLFLVLIVAYLIATNLKKDSVPQPVTLQVWGVASKDAMAAAFDFYKAEHPTVTINYTQYPREGYEARIVDALAAGQGPDIFMIGNHDLVKFANKITPADPGIFSAPRAEELFPRVVVDDFTHEEYVYALPLSIDTLALFYDKNAFDQAAIISPPRTWADVQESVSRLRSLGGNGQVLKAAIALGGSERSVAHGADILAAIMMQNGVTIVDKSLVARFADDKGLQAFNFYLQFANNGSSYFTWTDDMQSSLEAFAGGKTAMAIGYLSDWNALKDKNPYSEFGFAPLPQVSSNQRSFARYYGLAVSGQGKNQAVAWDVILKTAANPDAEIEYLRKTGESPALKSVIGQVAESAELGVFAKQALIARSWYDADGAATKVILNTAIRKAITGASDPRRALAEAQDAISDLSR